MKTVSRDEAKAAGLRLYFDGRTCRNGHVAERLVRTTCCIICYKAGQQRWADKNRARINEKTLEHYHRNRDRCIKTRKKYREANKEKMAAYKVEWNKNNPIKKSAQFARWRARKLSAEGSYTQDDIADKLIAQSGRCNACVAMLTPSFHIDHVMPLVLGGTNWPNNLQLLCPDCNRSKSGRHPDEWERNKNRGQL